MLLTDSGGLQREAAILNIPCFVIRNETEYNELVELGKIKLIGTSKDAIADLDKITDSELEDMKSISYKCSGGVSSKIMELL